jgi:aldose 1-epimerase
VVEVGGGLRAYEAAGRPVLDGYGRDEMCSGGRGQALLPWPNRVRDGQYAFAGRRLQLGLTEPEAHNAIHGLTRWMNWTAVQRDTASVRMELVLHPQTGYPFTLVLAIDYRLGEDGLSVTTQATNVGDGPCPYGAGAHPYLTAGAPTVDVCTLSAPGARRLLSDEQSIPVGSEPVQGTDFDFRTPRPIGALRLDTCYCELARDMDGRARVQLSAPSGDTVTLWQDASYPYLMVFTGDTLAPDRRRRGLAVEPMTCAPNALASGDGLLRLEPGETAVSCWGIAPGGR